LGGVVVVVMRNNGRACESDLRTPLLTLLTVISTRKSNDSSNYQVRATIVA